MAVGAIFEPDHVNSILMAGRADLCALARPHLADPYWTLHAAAQLRLSRHRVAGAISGGQGPARAQPRARGATGGRACRRQMAEHVRVRHRGIDSTHAVAPDPETRLHDAHHESLRLWLRLLTCTLMIERRVRAPAARAVRDDAAALRPDGAARAQSGGAQDGRAVAPVDGDRRQRHRD
mgnify:CR=1 FL=1